MHCSFSVITVLTKFTSLLYFSFPILIFIVQQYKTTAENYLLKLVIPIGQVKEHIFIDSNKLTKSKQIMLNTLNELRMCYVLERSTFSEQTKREKVRVNALIPALS